MPCIYTLAGLSYFNDYTIMRAMVMDFGYDPLVRKLGHQKCSVPSLLVAPVCEYKAREREIYLPASSGWYDFYSGKHIRG